MLIANICELDELPFLKKPRYKWIPDEQQGQKSKIRLLQNLRSLSYQCSDLMSKILNCQKQIKRDTSSTQQNDQQEKQAPLYEQLLITTQKQILSLEKFFYMINQILSQQQFSLTVSSINGFVAKCKTFIKDVVSSKYQIDFGNKEFLSFGIYLQKQAPDSLNFSTEDNKNILQKFNLKNKFYVKCAVTNYNYEPFSQIRELKSVSPQPFMIKNPVIIEKLLGIYLELTQIYLPIRPKDIKKYVQSFDVVSHYNDEEYLKLQVFKNYPLLRSKFYLPVMFNDRITGERLEGPIFSNSDPDCMFSHFIGYNADRIMDLQGNNCEQCRTYIEGVQQNPILTHLRDNPFNPYKTDVLYCPEFNRFKLIIKTSLNKTENEEEEEQKVKFKTQIKYLNYLHMRCNMKKIQTKKRNKFNDMLDYEKFPLTFDFWGRKILIMDPARGKNCSHYEFTDLRSYYLNKVTQNTFRCPICDDVMSDNDILYLKQVQILLKYLKFKCSKFKEFMVTGSCYIDHREGKLFLEYKKRGKQNKDDKQTEIIEMKNFYQTLIDPYVSFNEYPLGIPDKHQQRQKQKYLFGLDQQNQDKDSDSDFQYKDLLIDSMKNSNQLKKGLNTESQLD